VFPAIAGALIGCGRLNFADRRAPDAGVDAMVDAFGTCDPAAAFGTPVAITELDDPAHNDGTLRLLPDELSGYFWSYRGGATGQIYLATRPDLASAFTITPVQGLNVAGNLLDPTTSPDGSLLVFRHNMPGDDLYEASRITPDTFASAVAITNLNSASTVQPFLPLVGNEMFFSSSRTGGGDLYRTTRTGTTFATPTQVTELSTASDEGDPVLAPDGLTLYFRSDRPGGPGGYNIYVATRPTTADPFGAAQLVPNVNSDADDGPSWISPDGCRLYISSARAGTNDIYVSTRTH
jgi:Tol biopolymer transport system component